MFESFNVALCFCSLQWRGCLLTLDDKRLVCISNDDQVSTCRHKVVISLIFQGQKTVLHDSFLLVSKCLFTERFCQIFPSSAYSPRRLRLCSFMSQSKTSKFAMQSFSPWPLKLDFLSMRLKLQPHNLWSKFVPTRRSCGNLSGILWFLDSSADSTHKQLRGNPHSYGQFHSDGFDRTINLHGWLYIKQDQALAV